MPAVRAGLQELHRNPPDIVYSSAPPWTGQLVACVLAARLRRPWVADFRDPWARLPWRENRPWIVRRAAALFEDVTVRRAAAVVFTTRRIRDDVAAHHDARLSTKYHVIANGCDLEEFQTVDVRPQDSQFVLLHAGSLYGGRDPRSLMRAIATAARRGLLDPRRFRLRLLGTVALDGVDLPRTCNELGIGDIVEVVPRMSRRDSLAEMTSASALLLMQQGHPLSVPAKAYEYLASGRPILAIADEGETADLIRNSGGGMVISGRDEEQTVQALAELVRLPRHGRHVDAVWFDGARRSADVVDIFATVLVTTPGARLRQLASRRWRAVPKFTIFWLLVYFGGMIARSSTQCGARAFVRYYPAEASLVGQPLPDWRWNLIIGSVALAAFLIRRSSLRQCRLPRTRLYRGLSRCSAAWQL